MGKKIGLDQLKTGDRATIKKINANGQFKTRLMEMGFIKNTEIYVEKSAPLNDPVEYVIKGYHISLRRSEAAQIDVMKK